MNQLETQKLLSERSKLIEKRHTSWFSTKDRIRYEEIQARLLELEADSHIPITEWS